MSRAKAQRAPRTTNSKHEIRNSKQFQMTKICKIPNKLPSDSVFWIFPILDLFVSEFVSDFDIRILDLFPWLLGAITFFVTTVGP
jgi:hypothetical protein